MVEIDIFYTFCIFSSLNLHVYLYYSTVSRLIGCSLYLYFCIDLNDGSSVNCRCVCINQQPHGWLVGVVYLWFDKPTLERPIAWKSHGPNCTPHTNTNTNMIRYFLPRFEIIQSYEWSLQFANYILRRLTLKLRCTYS